MNSDVLSFAHVWVIVSVIVGNIVYLWERGKRVPVRAQEAEK